MVIDKVRSVTRPIAVESKTLDWADWIIVNFFTIGVMPFMGSAIGFEALWGTAMGLTLGLVVGLAFWIGFIVIVFTVEGRKTIARNSRYLND
ncbi:membrane protein [Gordonia phage Guey18]|nr:membrane protein [Gordonia phage Guey18]